MTWLATALVFGVAVFGATRIPTDDPGHWITTVERNPQWQP